MERLNEFYGLENAILIDVRQPEEFEKGRIPGARNVPSQRLRDFAREVSDRDTPIFVYCLSGGRSALAAGVLRGVGFTNVIDLGGIRSYTGELEI